jgi:hypothetical protein
LCFWFGTFFFLFFSEKGSREKNKEEDEVAEFGDSDEDDIDFEEDPEFNSQFEDVSRIFMTAMVVT